MDFITCINEFNKWSDYDHFKSIDKLKRDISDIVSSDDNSMVFLKATPYFLVTLAESKPQNIDKKINDVNSLFETSDANISSAPQNCKELDDYLDYIFNHKNKNVELFDQIVLFIIHCIVCLSLKQSSNVMLFLRSIVELDKQQLKDLYMSEVSSIDLNQGEKVMVDDKKTAKEPEKVKDKKSVNLIVNLPNINNKNNSSHNTSIPKKIARKCIYCGKDIIDTGKAEFLMDAEDEETGEKIKYYLHREKCLDEFAKKVADEVTSGVRKQMDVESAIDDDVWEGGDDEEISENLQQVMNLKAEERKPKSISHSVTITDNYLLHCDTLRSAMTFALNKLDDVDKYDLFYKMSRKMIIIERNNDKISAYTETNAGNKIVTTAERDGNRIAFACTCSKALSEHSMCNHIFALKQLEFRESIKDEERASCAEPVQPQKKVTPIIEQKAQTKQQPEPLDSTRVKIEELKRQRARAYALHKKTSQ